MTYYSRPMCTNAARVRTSVSILCRVFLCISISLAGTVRAQPIADEAITPIAEPVSISTGDRLLDIPQSGTHAFDEQLSRWTATLRSINRRFDAPEIGHADIASLNNQLRELRVSVLSARDQAATEVVDQRKFLDALGPTPAEGEPTEAQALATERSAVRTELALAESREKRSKLLLARLDDVLERTVRIEYATLLDLLSRRTVYPLSLDTFVTARAQLGQRIGDIHASLTEWWRGSARIHPLPTLVLALVALSGLLANRTLRRRRRLWQAGAPADTRPNSGQLLVLSLLHIVERAVIPSATLAVMAAILYWYPIFGAQVNLKASELLQAAARLMLLLGIVAALLAPRDPRWRTAAFTDTAANGLYRAVRLYVYVVLSTMSALAFLHPATDIGGMLSSESIAFHFRLHPELSALSAMLILAGGTATLLHVLRARHWQLVSTAPRTSSLDDPVDTDDAGDFGDAAEPEPDSRVDVPVAQKDQEKPEGADAIDSLEHPPSRFVCAGLAFARAALFLSLVAGAFGFLNVSVYIVDRTASTITLVGFALMLRSMIASALTHATATDSLLGGQLRSRLVLDDTGAARLAFWLLLVIDLALIVGGIISLALLWGMPLAALQLLASLLLYGVPIGNYTLSLVDLVIAIAAFLLVLALVRVLRGVLSTRILTQTRLDVGARDAVTVIVGYVGLTIAALVAMTTLGIDLDRVALILGALSVGIGFGLQHVVSNFVSGLILLATRPIKSGDWIVVGQHQGYVKHVNVVTTEIQTFDNAAVIVPNSSLVSSEVLNWTHKSTVGRVIVPVRADYDASPETVRDVLWRCLDGNEDVLRRPEPQVLFMGFGTSSLDFEVRFFIREIDRVLMASSDLRYRIVEAFRDAGISIPLPQQDLHLRDLRTDASEERSKAHGTGKAPSV